MPNIETEATQRLAWQVNPFCQALGISRTTLYALIAENKIKNSHRGGTAAHPRQRGPSPACGGRVNHEPNKSKPQRWRRWGSECSAYPDEHFTD